MNYAIEQRMRLIDFLLGHYGTIQRAALADYFGISIPQASKDLSVYNKLAPANMKYDAVEKCYRRTDQFKRIYP